MSTSRSNAGLLAIAAAAAAALLIAVIALPAARPPAATVRDVGAASRDDARTATTPVRQRVAADVRPRGDARVVEERTTAADAAAPASGEKRVSFEVVDRPLKDVLEYLQQAPDVYLVATAAAEEVPVTLRVEDVTWREALDRVARAGGFYVEQRSPRLIRIDFVRATYDYENADLREALVALAERVGASIVLGPEVTGDVTLSFENVPWQVALRRIAAEGGCTVVEERRGILRVAGAADIDASDRSRQRDPPAEAWETLRSADGTARTVTFDATELPLGEVVDLIRARTDVNIVVTEAAAAVPVSLRVRDLPWRETLLVSAERAGCRLDVRSDRLVIVERVPRLRFSFADAEVRQVSRVIALVSETSILVEPDAKGWVTASFRDVPARSALDAVASALGLVVEEDRHGILHVGRAGSTARRDAPPTRPSAGAPRLDFHVAQRPLGDVVALVREVADVDIDFASADAAAVTVTLTVRDLDWTNALTLAVERSGCTMERTGPGRIVIDRPARVTAAFVNAEAGKIVRSIVHRAGREVDVHPDVNGRLSMWLFDVPWRSALEVTAESLGLSVREGPDGVLRVSGD